MRKTIISLVVSIILTTTISMPILANPVSDNEQQRSAYNNAQSKIEDLEVSVEKMDSNIEKIYAQVDSAKVKIGETQVQIQKSTKDILVALDNIEEEEDLFNKRMRSMYINGMDSYLEILFNSEGFEDLISRVENIKKIVEYDNKIIAQLTDKKVIIEQQRATLETKKTKLVVMKTDNENKIEGLKKKKQEQGVLIAAAKKQRQIYASKLSVGQAIVNVSMNQIQQIRTNAPKYTPSRGASSLSSNAVVAYASNFLGTPYAWGGNGASTFDCSGFVKYVYAHFGVSLGRTTSSQINQGSYVSKGNLQAGDLVFFGSSSNPHHVGMYVGNNSYIHAPSTGDVVKVSAMTRSDFISGRRLN